jgi:hypothetical protein
MTEESAGRCTSSAFQRTQKIMNHALDRLVDWNAGVSEGLNVGFKLRSIFIGHRLVRLRQSRCRNK